MNLTSLERHQDAVSKQSLKIPKLKCGKTVLTSAMVSPTKSVLTDKNEQTGTRVKLMVRNGLLSLLNLGQKNLLEVGDKIKKVKQ